jgi:hypothetical protein
LSQKAPTSPSEPHSQPRERAPSVDTSSLALKAKTVARA